MSDDQANQALLRRAWKARNGLYQDLFGDHAFALPKRYEVPSSLFADAQPIDQSGPPGAIMESLKTMLATVAQKPMNILVYPPGERNSYWTYLTSGLSNPWFQDEATEVSGFGVELMIKTSKWARWPVRALRRMAFYITSYSGTLSPGVVLKTDKPILGPESAIDNVIVWYADEAPDAWYQLPTGGFGIFCAIGITEDECQYAESVTDYGVWCIQNVLRRVGLGQVTDPSRQSIMKMDNIESLLKSARDYADNFRAMEQQQDQP